MRIPNAHYLIIDFEATCSNNDAVARDEMEIIEIGASMLHAHTYQVESEFQSFVKPVRHPTLTTFCTDLTTITQDQVDAARPFRRVLAEMVEWVSRFDDPLFCSWGDYDRNQLTQDCQFHTVAYPFGPAHLNLKAAFTAALKLRKPKGVGAALRRLGLKFDGTPHRGIDDVRNIARIVRHVCGSGQPT